MSLVWLNTLAAIVEACWRKDSINLQEEDRNWIQLPMYSWAVRAWWCFNGGRQYQHEIYHSSNRWKWQCRGSIYGHGWSAGANRSYCEWRNHKINRRGCNYCHSKPILLVLMMSNHPWLIMHQEVHMLNFLVKDLEWLPLVGKISA